jgi:nucleotide-binding universal stress UspA family protein
LLEEAATHAGGSGDHDVAVLFVEEVPGLFVPRDTQPSREAREVLADAVAWLNAQGFTAVPIWRLAQEAGDAIVQVALELGVNAILVGTSQRGTLWRFLRGNVLARLAMRTPREVRIVIIG